jgi:hypothetical protein
MTSETTEPNEREFDVLYLSPDRFRAQPQIGTACRMTWRQITAYLSRPSSGEAKDEGGAWSPGLYRDNVRRKSHLISIGALVVDVDEAGDVLRSAEILSRYRSILHETFSSTDDAPRCRIVLALAEAVDAAIYERAHAVVRAHLRRAGLVADDGAKDASRLSYSPVRRPGARYRFATTEGAPLDTRAVLAAQPPPPPRPIPRPIAPEHADAYVRGALRRAADAIASATPGERHYALSREAFSLARLGLDESQISSALLPAFVAAAGERREYEGARTIRDAIRARRGAA